MKYTKSIKKAFDFKKTLNYGKFKKGKYIAIYILPQRKQEENFGNLFGICVSKKHGNSVVRNRLKRWAREVYKINEERIKTGYLIVLLYKKDIKGEYDSGNITFDLIRQDVEICFNTLNLFRE